MRVKRHRRKTKFSFSNFIGGIPRFFQNLNYKKLLWGAGLGMGIIIILLTLYSIFFLPSVEDSDELAFAQSTIIYDRGALDSENDPNEHILYTIHGDENREYLPLEEISPWLPKATLAIEDDGFYWHPGFDLGGIIKAVMHEFFGIGPKRGGSTITQQLAKNVFLSRERKISRKFKELLLAIKLEIHYKKDEILELYLNKIPYGHNSHGAEAAAKTFFGKSARDLTIAESAILASLPVAPTRFSPYGANKDLLMGYDYYDEETGTYEYKKGRKDLVLLRMWDLGMITEEQFIQARIEANNIEFKRAVTDIKAPHFVFQVRERLEQKYGREFLRQGGLRIYTTLDPEIQSAAEEIVAVKSPHYSTEYNAHNVALTTINNDTGEILAYIGGKDFFDEEHDGQVDVLTSKRQPGSSFKPLVFATAFDQGYSPATVVFDVQTDFGGNYQPENFNGEYQGPVSFRTSLNESLNIPSIKAAYLATPAKILDMAKILGIEYEGTAKQHNVALGVGVAEVEPLSHINSFQAFAGDGSYHEPSFILEVRDSEGNVLEKADFDRKEKEGLDSEIAALVRNILTDETTRPTTDDFSWNKLLELGGDLNNGAKTGTSNRVAENPEFNEEEPEDEEENPKFITVPGDSWTVGFTPHLITGVWVGNNRGEPMNPGATGLAVAAPIWKSVMLQAHDILFEQGADPKKVYDEPTPLTPKDVNKYSGKLATEETPEELKVTEYFASFNTPTELDDSIQEMEIDRNSGRRVGSRSSFSRLSTVKKKVLKLESILPDRPNWQNPVTEWIDEHPRFIASLGVTMDNPEEDQDVDLAIAGLDPSGRNFSRWDTRLLRRNPGLLHDDIRSSFQDRNHPKISIISPKDNANIAHGDIQVQVSTSARFGIQGVEYFFDNVLVDEATIYPYTGSFKVPDSLSMGSTHSIRSVAVDKLGNQAVTEIEVTIARDTEGPIITFLGPVGNQRIPINSTVQVLTQITDQSSAVASVEFFLDDQVLSSSDGQTTSFTATGKLGRHFLKAVAKDVHGNQTEKSIPVQFEREKLFLEDKPFIQDIKRYRSSASADLLFPSPESLEFAEVIVSQEGEVVFYHKIQPVTKFAQVQIPKNFEGAATVQLLSKMKGSNEPYQSPTKRLEW